MQNRIRELRKQHKITMKQLGEVIGVAESTISQYETGKREPDNETLLRLGEYFGVSVDYLLGAAVQKETPPALTKKDERDILLRIDQILSDLEGQQTGLMFDGEPLDDETKELLAASLRSSMETSKVWAKKKFTPKKYRKDE